MSSPWASTRRPTMERPWLGMVMLAAVPVLSLILVRLFWSGSSLWFLTVGITLLGVAAIVFLAGRTNDQGFGRQTLAAETSRLPLVLTGLGVLFLAMILFTLFYASGSIRAGSMPAFIMTGTAGAAVYIHLLMQLAYTIRVHEEALSLKRRGFVSAIVAGTLVIVFAFVIDLATVFRSMDIGEIVYRSFISCYGFIFPAYVYLIMIPTRDGHRGTHGESGRKKLRILFLAVGVAGPMMWMGFMERMELWIVPGLAIVLLARLALPGKPAAPQHAKTMSTDG